MASRAIFKEQAVILKCSVLILIVGFCCGSPNQNHRLICWKAILKCHGEPECKYAYNQYLYACASVIHGESRKCPSHCISSLIQLNLTRNGPSLEDCDCAQDPVCKSTKQAIDPCLPRTSTLGCTEARVQCEMDPDCSSALKDYLFHCRKLFGEQMCTDSCRSMISTMRSIPKAQQLDTCVCDGNERVICEYIKLSMQKLCSDSTDRFAGSGFSDTEEDTDEDYLYQEDYPRAENTGSTLSQKLVPTLITMLLLSQLI